MNFIQHIVQVLVKGGRAAIVLPDSVLTEDKATDLWKEIMQENNIHTILKLPNGTFLPYANVKAVVIFLKSGEPTNYTWIYDGRTNVESVTKKSRPLKSSHFSDFENVYGSNPNSIESRTESNRFRKYSIEEIEEKKYRLDFTWLKEELDQDISEMLTPIDLATKALDELELVMENLKDIIQSLDE